MKASEAQEQMQTIYDDATKLLKIEKPTDSDWARLCELYQQFIDRMDEWEIDTPTPDYPVGYDAQGIDQLADMIVERMHNGRP